MYWVMNWASKRTIRPVGWEKSTSMPSASRSKSLMTFRVRKRRPLLKASPVKSGNPDVWRNWHLE